MSLGVLISIYYGYFEGLLVNLVVLILYVDDC